MFMVMRVCVGVQLGGRCCWHGQWIYLVRVTGSVVDLAVLFLGVCALHNFIFKELVLPKVRFYLYVMLLYNLHVIRKIVCSRKENFDVRS